MPSSFSPMIVILYLFLVLVVQTAIDSYFTRPILPAETKKRSLVLFTANTIGMVVTVLLFRLVLPLNHAFLISSRTKGTMGIAVLVAILEYFPWVLPYMLLRGWIVKEWLMGDEIMEKRQAWWSYAIVGVIATFVLVGPFYLAVTIVQPLMFGAEEVFSN